MIDYDAVPFATLLPVHDRGGDLLCVCTADQAREMLYSGFEVEETDEDLGDVLSIRETKADE